jgi:hypothetical protein
MTINIPQLLIDTERTLMRRRMRRIESDRIASLLSVVVAWQKRQITPMEVLEVLAYLN